MRRVWGLYAAYAFRIIQNIRNNGAWTAPTALCHIMYRILPESYFLVEMIQDLHKVSLDSIDLMQQLCVIFNIELTLMNYV